MPIARHSGLIKNTGQDLSMIQTNGEVIESKRNQRIACRGDQFRLYDHRTRAEYIDVALIELPEAPPRGTIGAPNGLNLIAFEKLRQIVLILRDDARERNRQIVAQREIGLAGLFMLAALENFEDELIAFFTVLAHQGLDIFDRRSLQRLETVPLVNLFNNADHMLALAHVGRQRVPHTARRLCFG